MSAVESDEELYLGEWTYQPGPSRLVLARGFSASGVHTLRLGDEVRIDVEFSEPMASATLVAIVPAVGTPSALTSTQGVDQRTSWSATVTIDQIPNVPPLPHIHISGTDLAGTTLYPFANGAPLSAPFNKRANATPITNPTQDDLHVIPLFARHAPQAGPGG